MLKIVTELDGNAVSFHKRLYKKKQGGSAWTSPARAAVHWCDNLFQCNYILLNENTSLENPLLMSSELEEGLTNFVTIDLSVLIHIYLTLFSQWLSFAQNIKWSKVNQGRAVSTEAFAFQILVIIFPGRYREISSFCLTQPTQNRNGVLLQCSCYLVLLSTFAGEGVWGMMAFLRELIDVTTSGSGLALMELNFRDEFHRAREHTTEHV